MKNKNVFLLGLLPAIITSCAKHDPILPGERTDIFSDKELSEFNKSIKKITTEKYSFENNNAKNYSIKIDATNPDFDLDFSRNIGYKIDDMALSIPRPVITDGTIYISDSFGNIRVFDSNTGKIKWKNTKFFNTETFSPSPVIAVIKDKLILTKNMGEVFAFDSQTGKEIWKTNLGVALHGPIQFDEKYIYTTAENNDLYKINTETGTSEKLFSGMAVGTNMLGSAKPAISGENVFFGMSTGDVVSLNKNNKSTNWFASVYKNNLLTGGHNLTDILSDITLDNNNVYVAGIGYELASLNQETGKKNWSKEIPSNQNIWLINENIFTVSTDGKLIALDKKSGDILYLTQLPTKKTIHWFNPNLIWNGESYQIWVFSEKGEIAILDAESGNLISSENLTSDDIANAPIIDNNRIHIITADGYWKSYEIENN